MEDYKKYLPMPLSYNYVTEVWLPVKGYEGLYEVSNLGEIRSLNYCNKKGNVVLIKQANDKDKYKRICLKKKNFFIHRLVYEAFRGKIPEGLQVDHVNSNPTDNRLENLRLVSPKENMANPNTRARLHNTANATYKKKGFYDEQKQRLSILSLNKQKHVYQYDLEGNFIKIWDCAADVKKALGYENGNIGACCNGKYKQAYGYIWSFTELDNDTLIKKIADAKKCTKPVKQFSLDGVFIKVWESIKEAGETLEISRSNISSCCRRRIKSAGGYVWRYA